MHLRSLALLSLLPLVLLFTACGSSGDDDDDSSDEATPGSSSSNSGSNKSSVSDIKNGNYRSGKVHVEVSGDAKGTFDADGTGYADGGIALLTYGSRDAAVLLSFEENGDGALSVTTNDYAGAWDWGKDCKLNADQSDDGFEGEFSCEKVEAVSPTSTKTFKLSIKGTFTAGP